MKRVLTLLAGLALAVTVVGCAAEPRDSLVDSIVGYVDGAASKVTSIKNKIDEAAKKTDAGKAPDFKDALSEIDALKKIATEMREKKINADAIKDKTTERSWRTGSGRGSSVPLIELARRRRSSTRRWWRLRVSTRTRSRPSGRNWLRPMANSRQ
jgi:hypothetical protein